jgi:predicted  nucleic acid-binding Zn-ribbon protein
MTLTELQNEITEAETTAKQLREKLTALEVHIDSLKEEAIAEKHGLHKGRIVIETKSGNEYLISSVDPTTYSYVKPWVWGYKKNIGGEWSKKETNLYTEWTLK